MPTPSPIRLAGQALDAARGVAGTAERLPDLIAAVLDIRNEVAAMHPALFARLDQLDADVRELQDDFDGVRHEVRTIREQLDEVLRLIPDPAKQHQGLVGRAVDAITPDE